MLELGIPARRRLFAFLLQSKVRIVKGLPTDFVLGLTEAFDSDLDPATVTVTSCGQPSTSGPDQIAQTVLSGAIVVCFFQGNLVSSIPLQGCLHTLLWREIVPKPYYAARKTLNSNKSCWDAWEGHLKLHPALDEFNASIGIAVSSNLRKDGMIGKDGFERFIRKVVLDSVGSPKPITSPAAAVDEFLSACYSTDCQRLGARTSVPSRILWHITTEGQLKESFTITNYLARDPRSTLWPTFRDACIMRDIPTAHRLLRSGLPLHPQGFQVFATFRLVGGPAGGDPDVWTASEACAALGLSTQWPAYQPGSKIWIIRYDAGPLAVAVPTCADAGFRSTFVPSSRRTGTICGFTRPLGALQYHPQGMPEVVHEAATVYPPGHLGNNPNTILDDVPRFLGATS